MLRRTSHKRIGIIAEDRSDVESIRILASRISDRNNLSFEKFVGRGAGNIIRKCYAWSCDFKLKGCSLMVIVHDSDGKSPMHIENKIKMVLKSCPFDKYIITIPVQELEAWFLCDSHAIQSALSLRKRPSIKGMPESINSPKEYLSNAVRRADNRSEYLHTVHNSMIADVISIPKIRSECPSFLPFYDFIKENL